jgi:hypothetical protein
MEVIMGRKWTSSDIYFAYDEGRLTEEEAESLLDIVEAAYERELYGQEHSNPEESTA